MSEFKTTVVHDPTIGDITSELVYQVKTGASSTTYQPFPATSSANSNITFNVTVPSENIVVGRDILLESALSFRLNISAVPSGSFCCVWGLDTALQAFPLAQLMTTGAVTINNTTTSENIQETLPQLMRMNNSRELYRYNSTTPSLPDQAFYNYADAVDTNANPLASYNNTSYDLDQQPRGAFPCFVQIQHFIGVASALTYVDASPVSTGVANENWIVQVFTNVCEPVFLSPFTWGNPEFNAQGLLGITALNFNFNIDSQLSRLVSTASAGVVALVAGCGADYSGAGLYVANPSLFTAPSVSTGAVATSFVPTVGSPTLLMKFLSTQPSDKIETRNVVPYMNFPRYITSQAGNVSIASGARMDLNSSNIQISQLPDYFIIVVRQQFSTLNCYDANAFLAMKSISINLNNQSGLLSSMSAENMWRMSCKNGSNQSWLEFNGQAFYNIPASGTGAAVATTGSVFVVSPSDLSLPNYLVAGSMGQFNFQFRVNVFNQTLEPVQAEICVICANSGIMALQQGTANIYTGVLGRQMVLDTLEKKEEVVSTITNERMVGGMMHNRMSVRHPRFGKRFVPKMGGAISGGKKHAGMY